MTALKKGNTEQMLTMLDPNVVLVADGGGKVFAAINPINTRDHVTRYLLGAVRKAAMVEGEVVIELTRLQGQPAFILRSKEGIVHTVGVFDVQGEMIRNLYIVRNPDKLKMYNR
jgi:RNA polymerase sigma-70 factor (ECF subfamily)